MTLEAQNLTGKRVANLAQNAMAANCSRLREEINYTLYTYVLPSSISFESWTMVWCGGVVVPCNPHFSGHSNRLPIRLHSSPESFGQAIISTTRRKRETRMRRRERETLHPDKGSTEAEVMDDIIHE